MPHASRHLSPLQLKGLNKLGDVYAPGDERFPSFSQLGCVVAADRVLDYLPAGDRGSLKLLLGALRFVPTGLIAAFCRLLERAPTMRGPWGGPLRFLRMGIKGLIMTLYYSGEKSEHFPGPTPLEVLEYRVGVYTGDLPAE